MSVELYMDHHVDTAVTEGLRRRAVDVLTCRDNFAGLVYGHQLDLSIGQVIRDLELIATVYDPVDMRDRVEYLPL
jgi:hypothetical protein